MDTAAEKAFTEDWTDLADVPSRELGKIVRIFSAFSEANPTMTIRQVQLAAGMHMSTCHRLVNAMVAHGLLDRVGEHVTIGAGWAQAMTTHGLGGIRANQRSPR
jgi:hypothetical protein